MSSQILGTIEPKMMRAVEILGRDLQGIRTGRAATSLVERIHVDYYGTSTPLNQLAGISVPEPHVGLTPNVDGIAVRLNIPQLTEERRRDLVKQVHRRMEEARIEIRNLRREAADAIKKEERDGELGTDEAHRDLEILQKVTDRHVAEVDKVGEAKEREVLEV
jgi:ribosome recycling factor